MSKLCGMATYQLVTTGLCVAFFITTGISVYHDILISTLNILIVSMDVLTFRIDPLLEKSLGMFKCSDSCNIYV